MNEQTSHLMDEIDEDTQKGRFLTFLLGNESYGIEIIHVTEIVGLQPIIEMPELPDFVKGIINLRGKIIPVMDARLKFKKEPKEYNDRTCIVVIDVLELSIGIIVDEVSEVLNISEDNIVPPPNIKSSGRKYIKYVGKNNDNVVLILDVEKLVNEEEISELKTSDS